MNCELSFAFTASSRSFVRTGLWPISIHFSALSAMS